MGNTRLATKWGGESHSTVFPSTAAGSCRWFGKHQGLFLFITCSLLFTIVFMAVDQYSHQPKHGKTEGAADYKQIYNHGAMRGPHILQKSISFFKDSQSKSRKLLDRFEARSEDGRSGMALGKYPVA